MAGNRWGLEPLNAPTPAANPWGLAPLGTEPPALTPPGPKMALDTADAIRAGFQDSGFVLLARGKMPDYALPDDAPWYHRAARGVGAVVGDFIPGTAAALAAAPGGPVAMGAAGFGVPMAIRGAVIEAYNNGHAADWPGVLEIAKAGFKEGTKGAVIGAATMGAGRFVSGAVRGGAATKGAAALTAEVTTMTATASALEGHIPAWQDFMDNAILLGGLKGAVGTASYLRETWRQTGKTPAEVLADAQRDPALKAEITALDDLRAKQQTALKEWEGAETRAAKLAEEGAARAALDAARKEADTAKKAYDALAEQATKVPDAYLKLALDERIKAALPEDSAPVVARELLRASADPQAVVLQDPVRYEYVTDRATAEGVVRAVAEAYKAEVETQRRGTVKVGQSVAEGVALVNEGKLKPHEIGDAANSGEIAARALLTKMAAERVKKLADEIPSDPAKQSVEQKLQFAAAMEQLGLFYKELAGAGAEVARALNMLGQLKRNPALLGDATSLVRLQERKAPLSTVLDMVRALKDPEAVRQFTEGYLKPDVTTFDQVIEVWKASILSGIHTTGANVIGNVGRFVAEVPSAMLTATLEAARLAAAGTPMTAQLYAAKALSPIYGVVLGAKDAFTAAGEMWRVKDGSVLAHQDVYQRALPEGKFGDVVQLPFRWLRAQDALFRTFGERAKAHELAVERAGREGLDPRTHEFNEAVSRYTKTPQAGLTADAAKQVTSVVENAGLEWVYGERLGPRFEGASRAIQGSPAEFVIPFRRTPVNIASWAVQHTPGLHLMSARWWGDMLAGGERQSRAIARVVIGAGMAAFAFSLVEQGMLTGSGLFDPETSGTKRGAKWQPNSLFINGEYYSLERIEPIAKPLIVAANVYEMLKVSKDKGENAKLGVMAVLAFGNATISTTYMSGLSNAMKATLEPNRHMEGFIEGYASSLVPKIIGQTVASFDPYKREVDGAMDAIQSQLPLFREKLLPQRDVWGEPVENRKLFSVLPVQTSTASHDKVKTEAVRLQVAISRAPNYDTVRGPLKPSERQFELSPEQKNLWTEARGKLAMELLTPLVNHPNWERIPGFAQANAYREAFKKAAAVAEAKAVPWDDPARQKAQQKLIDSIQRQADEAQGR